MLSHSIYILTAYLIDRIIGDPRALPHPVVWIGKSISLHPSPNSGYPEAAIAGALNIQLWGTNFYFGVPSHRAKMGEPVRQIEPDDILHTILVMKTSATICVFLFFIISLLLGQYNILIL
ncbi:hypothetical protein CVD25_21990 [Bacillus canaveralius]|uniref:Cobalamin biosynthesis protein CobD n=1 Tax=Bacillus canaveralius TaxID=1403243 RepID=A0A2N5GHW6_9BACI|nr:cobalamin biosynthesis protein [Bacillus canaveralius]PLR80393.1 hypothetical protein CU635_18380 [Bacillus canaveralius]PLR88852.1 hypothetical protein CVD25_21990 [Bacillus canaveralius]